MTTSDKKPDDPARAAEMLLAQNPILLPKISTACDVSCNREGVLEILVEVVRFLQLIVANGKILSPSHRVDLAWHELILCTKAYGEFCREQFGRMIHHTPGGDPSENKNQYHLTLALYEDRFGLPPSRFWGTLLPGEAADCGPCEGANSALNE